MMTTMTLACPFDASDSRLRYACLFDADHDIGAQRKTVAIPITIVITHHSSLITHHASVAMYHSSTIIAFLTHHASRIFHRSS